MKRKITDSVNNSYRFDLSVTKKPILKFSNDSNIDNETGHSKLKVSFSNELEFSENIEIFNNEQLANPIESNTKKIKTIEEITLSSTPTSRRYLFELFNYYNLINNEKICFMLLDQKSLENKQ